MSERIKSMAGCLPAKKALAAALLSTLPITSQEMADASSRRFRRWALLCSSSTRTRRTRLHGKYRASFRLTRRHIVCAAGKVIESYGRRGNHRMLLYLLSKLVAALRFREQIYKKKFDIKNSSTTIYIIYLRKQSNTYSMQSSDCLYALSLPENLG